MTDIFIKTSIILSAALLGMATPALALSAIPRNDGKCTLYNEKLECVDAAREFRASTANDGTIQMRVVNVSPNDVLNFSGDIPVPSLGSSASFHRLLALNTSVSKSAAGSLSASTK